MKKVKILIILVFFIIVTLSGQTIENSDKPIKGKWDLQLKKIWEIEGTGTELFGAIQNVRVAKDGKIYVLDNKLKKIIIFNKDGKFLSKFGKIGEGPGEFKTFRLGRQLFILKNDLLFVERGKIHYFSLDGQFKKTIKTPESITPRGFISKDVLISVPRITGVSNKKNRKIKSFNLLNNTETIISTFNPYEKASTSKEGNGTLTIAAIIIGSITPRMTVDYNNGNLFYGMSDNYKITKRDLKKKKESYFLLKGREQKKVSKSFLDDLAKRFKKIPPQMIKKILDGLPKKASFFQAIFAMDNGFVYVFISDPDSRSSQAIDVFSSDGKYLYSTNIEISEDNSIRTIDFNGNSLFISFEDEEGEIKLAKYQIIHPTL